MPLTRDELFIRLAELGIQSRTVDHPPAFTVQDNDAHSVGLPGADTKNLFLKDDKGKLFLVTAKTSTTIDLKALSKRLGAGRLSFGKPDLMLSAIGITPGAVTAFAIANDAQKIVTMVIDEALLAEDSINCHPLVNTATTNIARDDLLLFIRSTGHEPRFMALTAA